MNHKMIELQGKLDKLQTIVREFNNPPMRVTL